MSKINFVVIYRDCGDTCDGLSRVLERTKTFQDAQAEMTRDVNSYLLENPNTRLDVDEESHRIVVDANGEDACVWQILSL